LYAALRNGALFGSRFWVLEPLALMLVTCLAFVLLGAALNRVLIPRLNGE
jgi:ABC-type dipeptide/oligopeptide/nickel transport system permease subunit